MRRIHEKSIEDLIKQIKLIVFDFDGVFTDNSVYVFQNGMECVRCSRSDGIGLDKIRKLGINSMVISSEVNPVVNVRCEKLGIGCVHGCKDKLTELTSWIEKYKITANEVAFVGNDINDLTCMKNVGFPITVRDAHPDVIPYAVLQTNNKGGYGAVREICDFFEKISK